MISARAFFKRAIFFPIMTAAMLAVGTPCFAAGRVVVYTAVDRVFSEPVLKEFQQETGIRVDAVYDVEATKTVGLVNRLIAERSRPRADVFWNFEVGRTIQLARRGVLEPYRSVHWDSIPDVFKDKNYCWTGFAARARVLIYNTDLLKDEERPNSIFELVNPKWKGRVTIAYPLFGSTGTDIAALYARIGQEKAEAFLRGLAHNEVLVVDGNSVTRDLVADGVVPIGFTDTDDAYVAIRKGRPVKMHFPDNEGIGTLVFPCTVGLVKGGPNPDNGEKLIDYLLSEKVERMLAFGESGQIPLRSGVESPPHVPNISEIRAMDVDFYEVADNLEKAARFAQGLFIR